jgi:hypothetical protein
MPFALLAMLAFAQDGQPEPLKVDGAKLSFGARVAKQDVYEKLQGFIEYVLVFPKGKEYESLFICPVEPMALFEAMKKIGLETGAPATEESGPTGGKLKIWVEWKEGEASRREPIETFVWNVHTDKPMEARAWVFTGSREGYDPEQDKDVLQMTLTKNLMALYPDDSSVLIQNPFKPKDSRSFKPNRKLLPKEGTPVRIVFEAVK